MRRLVFIAVAALIGAVAAGRASAHETDQFTLPLDRPLADMGDFLDAVHYRAIEKAAEELNGQIAEAMRETDPDRRRTRLDDLHQPWRIAEAVHSRFDDAFWEVVDLEYTLRTGWAKELAGGERTHYFTPDWIYSQVHFPLDPRGIVLLFKSSTIKAYGVYFGTDKLSHFHHLGIMYYLTYLGGRAKGLSDEEAVARVRATYVGGPISEFGLLGYIPTGVYSNADLAANYMGMRFYENLTEPVRLKGEESPPLLVVKNEFYRINKHVRPESGWFGGFVSDHWNEALNPNLYDPTIRSRVSGVLRQRSERIVQFYTKVDGRPADPGYYERYARELGTYYGENYGHCQDWSAILTIGNTVWPEYARRHAEDATVYAHDGRRSVHPPAE